MNNSLQQFLKRLPHAVLGVAVVLALASLAVGGPAAPTKNRATTKVSPIGLSLDDKPVARDGKFGVSFAPIVKRVAPSVVKVTTTTKVKQTSLPEVPGLDNPWFRQFFGDEELARRSPRARNLPRQQGLGSGVIVTKDGYILTNNHVVDGADEVKVALQDGREFTAKVIGKDPKTDVAVVKVDAPDLPFLAMADSDKIEVGDLVLAVGNPFGIGQTVTMGMVSAVGRASMGLDYEDFIQTDAAINPGNSGGALVDVEGRLLGINTAILSRSGGNHGIGFAIPTSLAREVMEHLVNDGKVTRGYLGVYIQDITPALARQFNLKENQGALISEVAPRSPAEKGGLESGDVVLAFNGKPVMDSRHFKLAVARVKPGESAPIKVLRDGSAKSLKVTVREQPGAETVAKAGANKADDTGTLNGVGVADLDSPMRQQFKVPATVNGAMVTHVENDSPAREAGLKPGDVILEINRQPVKSADEAVRLTEKPKDKTTLLRVWSNGGTRYLVVDEENQG